MSVRPSMFGRATGLRPSLVSTGGTRMNGEIDLRGEFDKLIYGPEGDGAGRHSYPAIIRRMRRDSDGYPTRCTCLEASGNNQGNPGCSYCLGEGYLWDEEWVLTYSMFVGPDGGMANKYVRMPSGNVRTDYILFYLRYDKDIRPNDKIVVVRLDEDGAVELSSVTNSFIRESIYKPETIVKYRSDNGRIEYFGVYCREEDAIRNENPV
jgi:hypothetical protein